jgi:integrase
VAVRSGVGSQDTAQRESKRTGKAVPPREARDGPHIMRHSCCTWLMAAGVDVYEVSGYTGVSVEVLLSVYGTTPTSSRRPRLQPASGRRRQSRAELPHENGPMIAQYGS